MARRPNYGAEKRSRELSKQKKKEEKAEKRRQQLADDAESGVTHDGEMEVDPDLRASGGDES